MRLLGTAKPSLTISKSRSTYNLLPYVWPFISYLGLLTTRDLTSTSSKDPASKNPMLQLCSGQSKHSLQVSCLYWSQAQSIKSFDNITTPLPIESKKSQILTLPFTLYQTQTSYLSALIIFSSVPWKWNTISNKYYKEQLYEYCKSLGPCITIYLKNPNY